MVIRNKVLRLLVLMAILGGFGGPLIYVGFHQMYLKGMQAEARLLLEHLQALQKAYVIERGEALDFEYYGAARRGEDHCAQPEGAAKLGFYIAGCHEAKATRPRYAYKSESSEDDPTFYSLMGVSGSDHQGQSFVCFDELGEENWVISKNEDLTLVKSCW